MVDILRAIEVKVPADLAGGNEIPNSLLDLAYNNKDTLINGITNHSGASEAERFFYFNILPKLQAHGLADNEKVAGVRYRRSFLNKAGRTLFAELEKKALRAKAKRGEDPPKVGNTVEASAKKQIRTPTEGDVPTLSVGRRGTRPKKKGT